MGLDSVELVLAIEEAFEVSLPDADIGRVATVGELYELVVRQLEVSAVPRLDSAECLTGPTFYRVRRAIARTSRVTVRSIRPSTELATLLPSRDRRVQWRAIQSDTGLRFPSLTLGWGSVGLFLAVVVGCVAAGLNFRWGVAGFTLSSLLAWVGSRWWPAFPRQIRTVGDLVRDVVALNYGVLSRERQRWSREEVWDALCRAVVAQTGVPASQVVAEARLVDTLGID